MRGFVVIVFSNHLEKVESLRLVQRLWDPHCVHVFRWTLIVTGLLFLSACGIQDDEETTATEQGLFVVTAGDVAIEDGTDGNMVLTLSDVDSRAMWFTDRPERLADVVSVSDLMAAWTELGFADVPPNAGLVLSNAQGEATVIITMLDPRWSPDDRMLRMTGRPLAADDLPDDHFLSAHTDRLVETLPTSVEHVALFIDSAPIPPEFGAIPASCVVVPHVGGTSGRPSDACVPLADLPDFGSGGAVPDDPTVHQDSTEPPMPADETDVDKQGDSVIGPSMTDDIGG